MIELSATYMYVYSTVSELWPSENVAILDRLVRITWETLRYVDSFGDDLNAP